MGTALHSIRCSACDEPLLLNYVGHCPKCGDTQKAHVAHIQETVHVHYSLVWQHIHEYYEKHKILFPLMIVIAVASLFLGFALTGWTGFVVGLIIEFVTFVLGLRAVTKVQRIRERHES